MIRQSVGRSAIVAGDEAAPGRRPNNESRSVTVPRPLRIGVIGPARFPIAQPFIGGLEAHVWTLSRALTARGHTVSLFAAAGSDENVAQRVVPFQRIDSHDENRRDLSEAADLVAAEDLAYRSVMRGLIARGGRDFDIIHNHCLHPAPLAAAGELEIPMISTFHTPPIERVARTLQRTPAGNLSLAAVSRYAAKTWSLLGRDIHVVHNGVDVEDWHFGTGGSRLVWSGRLVPEKGADLAIDAAALTGRALDLAGPIIDREYFQSEIEPRLGQNVRYLGHLTQRQLAHTVGRAAVALVTPRWDEPYGLVVAEALACGTPVAAFARGGIPEIVNNRCARLAPGNDVPALALAITEALNLDRHDIRRHAERHCSMTRMVTSYEELYRSQLLGLHGAPGRGTRARLVRGHFVNHPAANHPAVNHAAGNHAAANHPGAVQSAGARSGQPSTST
jgi:glycosyltransferase involved in cell wall biosynthesis